MNMRPSNAQRRAVGYTRVSTEDQKTRPDDDRARITAACVAYGYELLEVIEDVGVSGKVPLAERPNGRRVHELIEARQPYADVLIVTNLDRLTRGPRDGMALVDDLLPNGRRNPVVLVSLDDHIDLGGAVGRFFARLRFLMAGFERELIGERTSNALKHKRATGQVYGAVPYGWDRDGDRLVPNTVEQEHIAFMRHERAEGRNDNQIADALNRLGVPGKRGGRWQANTVFGVLRTADEVGRQDPNRAG